MYDIVDFTRKALKKTEDFVNHTMKTQRVKSKTNECKFKSYVAQAWDHLHL